MENIKSAYNNNKFKIFAPTWNDEFDLPDGSYPIADIQDYFEFIIKKKRNFSWKSASSNWPQWKQKHNFFQNKNRLQIRIVDSWNNGIVRKWKKDFEKDKDGENIPKLEAEVV